MFDKVKIESELKKFLSLDFNCNIDDFDRKSHRTPEGTSGTSGI